MLPERDTITCTGIDDVGALYGQLAGRLEHIVRLDVRAPDAVIEDACQFAWSRLLHHRDRVRQDAVVSWLVQTAAHEALKVLRRGARELPLDGASDEVEVVSSPPADPSAAPSELAELRERLDGLSRLPERQQRVLWLQAFGLDYGEIAAYEGCTLRTVERQLLRARQRAKAADAA